MTEKVEWEVVEETAKKPGNGAATGGKPMLQGMLGPWWRWKLAGLLAGGAIILVLLIALAGMVALSVAAVALLSVGVSRLVRWLRGGSTGALARSHYGPPH